MPRLAGKADIRDVTCVSLFRFGLICTPTSDMHVTKSQRTLPFGLAQRSIQDPEVEEHDACNHSPARQWTYCCVSNPLVNRADQVRFCRTLLHPDEGGLHNPRKQQEIGRASCRERV